MRSQPASRRPAFFETAPMIPAERRCCYNHRGLLAEDVGFSVALD